MDNYQNISLEKKVKFKYKKKRQNIQKELTESLSCRLQIEEEKNM